mmetsp:Transcript_83669/g.162711  ORF Transcript_83669/g.162711 Transcript_83669/m.162711 type:complete len:225 (+) Transcript_83669:123-797(+)
MISGKTRPEEIATRAHSATSPPPNRPGIVIFAEAALPRRLNMQSAGKIPYKETPPSNPASSSATRKISGKAYDKNTGGPRASAAASSRLLPAFDNVASSLLDLDLVAIATISSQKSTRETDAPAIELPMAHAENTWTKSLTTVPPVSPSTVIICILDSPPSAAASADTMPRKTASHMVYMTSGVRLPNKMARRVRFGSLPRYCSNVGTTFWAPNDKIPIERTVG